MLLQEPDARFQEIRLPIVVVVDEGDVLSFGPPEALIPRCALAAVRLDDKLESVSEAPRDPAGRVRRPVVYDNDLTARVGLRDNAVETPLQATLGVECWHHNRHQARPA